jgi:hypothetical protein
LVEATAALFRRAAPPSTGSGPEGPRPGRATALSASPGGFDMSDEIMRRAASLSDSSRASDTTDAVPFFGGAEVIRRSPLSPAAYAGGLTQSGAAPRPPYGANAGALDMDELVDAVVERIEQRVVDELERRGRRQTPGAF